jgi:hypothetical protein
LNSCISQNIHFMSKILFKLLELKIFVFLLANVCLIDAAPVYPMMGGQYYHPIPIPYYQQGMIPQVPYPQYFSNFHPSQMMQNVGIPQIVNPSFANSSPGAGYLAAALNLPVAESAKDEHITGQIGSSVQLPITPKSYSHAVPLNILSKTVEKPKAPQIGSQNFNTPASNGPEKTAPLPVIY